MRRTIVIVLLIALFLAGCVTDTEIMIEETEPPVAIPTDTSVPPTPTPVPPTPTPTPIPPTPTPIPDLNSILMTAGFSPVDPLLAPGTVIEELLEVTDCNSSEKAATNEFVHTIVVSLPTPIEVMGFEIELENPYYTLLAIVEALEGAGVDAKIDLAGATIVGEASKGVSFTTNIGGTVMRVDVVLFIEGAYGGFVVIVHPDGVEPSVDIWTVAQKLDEKIKSQ